MSVPAVPELLVSHWSISGPPSVIAGAYALLYLGAVTRVRGRWPIRRTVAFLAGLGVVLVALESGIARFDDQLLSVHMVQHMLLLMVAPLLLLAGQPAMLTLRALSSEHRPALARALAGAGRCLGPLTSLALFSVVLLGTHLPVFYEATLNHPAVHELEHALYLLAGLVLWWPMLDVDPAPQRRLSGLGRLGYMLAAMPAMALIGAYLNRHPTLVYAGYGPPGHALGVSAVTDQQQAGAIMWVAGGTIMTVVGLWAAMAALLAEERRQRARDARAPSTTLGGAG